MPDEGPGLEEPRAGGGNGDDSPSGEPLRNDGAGDERSRDEAPEEDSGAELRRTEHPWLDALGIDPDREPSNDDPVIRHTPRPRSSEVADNQRTIRPSGSSTDDGPERPRPEPAAFTRLPIIDAFCSVGPHRSRAPGTPYEIDDLLAEHERLGISGRLCLHAEARDGVPDEGNLALTRLTSYAPRTGLIWTALPPRRFGGTSAERLLSDAQAAGVAMFALFPVDHGHHLAPWANGDLYRAMESARLPLLLDLRQATYEQVHEIAIAHPRLPIVLWNAFYMDERKQVPLLDACPNVCIGLATVFIPTWGIEQYTARYGPDRLIFGSNWPFQSPGPLLAYVQYAEVRDHVKDAILGDTIRRLVNEVRWPVRGFEAGPA